MILNEVRIEGFAGGRWADEWDQGIQEMRQWIEKVNNYSSVF